MAPHGYKLYSKPSDDEGVVHLGGFSKVGIAAGGGVTILSWADAPL